MQPQEAQASNYLAYVGLMEGLREVRTAIVAWFFITAIGLVVGYSLNVGEQALNVGALWNGDWPRWITATLAFALLFWMLQGQTLRIPKLSFGAWLLSVGGFAAYVAALEYAPWWVIWPLISAATLGYGTFDELNALGREHYEQRRLAAQAVHDAARKGPPEGGPVVPQFIDD
jgi:hypothetical protein